MKKANILIPIAGRGQRFVDQGFVMPKQLIMVDGKQMIDRSLESIKDLTDHNLIFCVRRDHVSNFSIDNILKSRYGDDITIVVVDEVTRGSVETCMLAKKYIDNDDPLVVYTLDVCFEPKFALNQVDLEYDGCILTFKSNNPAYSYVEKDVNGFVTKTAEKEVISDNSAVGIYTFTRGSDFVEAAIEMMATEATTNGEYYVCPLYNIMIAGGKKITTLPITKMHLMGTPEELDFYVTRSIKKFGDKPIALCADHSGYGIKEVCKDILDGLGISYVDYGTFVTKDCDYNDYVFQATDAINTGASDFVLAFCRSGQGVNIAGNKQPGIRGALIYDVDSAKYAMKHNCANYFAIPSRITTTPKMSQIIDMLLNETFDGGRHATRILKSETPR